MLSLRQILIPTLTILLLSCKRDHGYTYAIKDFRKSLQSDLTLIVSKDIMGVYGRKIWPAVTDKELIQLSQSEHPILRASALREMLQRNTFNHFDVVMNHLEDTAIVIIDYGEFGVWNRMVSDDLLEKALWKAQGDQNKTIDLVLTKHNYLKSAYTILLNLAPQEKYYSFIKDMATRPRLLSIDKSELGFADIEYALYGLAKFKKKEDVNLIKEKLLKNCNRLSFISFRIMKEFPDTAYTEVFKEYHRTRFYSFSTYDLSGFSGGYKNRAGSSDFIEALAAQKSQESARIFDTILRSIPKMTCTLNNDIIADEVVMQIWQTPNPAYEKLRFKIAARAKEILKWQLEVERIPYVPSNDTTKEHIRW